MALTRLKQLREEAVLTVHELAEASGVSDDTISKIENGQRVARPNTLRKLAHALNVSPQELRRPAKVEELVLPELVLPKVKAPGEAVQPEVASALEAIREFLQARVGTRWLALPDPEWDNWWLGVPRGEVVQRHKQIESEWQLLKYEWAAIVRGEPSALRFEHLLEAINKMWARVIEARYSAPRKEESTEEFQRRRLEGKKFRTFYEPLEQVWPAPEELPREEEGAS